MGQVGEPRHGARVTAYVGTDCFALYDRAGPVMARALITCAMESDLTGLCFRVRFYSDGREVWLTESAVKHPALVRVPESVLACGPTELDAAEGARACSEDRSREEAT